jgi:hypothetical protein
VASNLPLASFCGIMTSRRRRFSAVCKKVERNLKAPARQRRTSKGIINNKHFKSPKQWSEKKKLRRFALAVGLATFRGNCSPMYSLYTFVELIYVFKKNSDAREGK